MNDILVIPDVHGRRFWKEAVETHTDCDIIFLGDYLDPYPVEGISPEETVVNFEEILDFAKSNPRCRLLLGNHDLHYLCNFGEACRLDYHHAPLIRAMLINNMQLFRLVELREIDERTVVFSHAPILTEWIRAVGETFDIRLLSRRLNRSLEEILERPWVIEDYLSQMSEFRGGYDSCGSPVWADVREVRDNIIPSAGYSVFGHTQQQSAPVITDRWACLDCRKAFIISQNLEISIA